MKHFPAILVLLAITACGENSSEVDETNQPEGKPDSISFIRSAVPATDIKYPETRKSDHADVYHGVRVEDPYVWLENNTEQEVKDWVATQNTLTADYLGQIPMREKIRTRLAEIWSYARQSAPFRKGPYLFDYRNDGTQNQDVLYLSEADGEPQVWLDPNQLSTDGPVALTGTYFSKNAEQCVYSTSKAGSDWRTFQVVDVATKQPIGEQMEWIKFSGASWYKKGFFYSRYPTPEEGQEYSTQNVGQSLHYYRPGAEQPGMEVIADKNQEGRSFGAQVFEDENWAVVYTWASTSGNAFSVLDLKGGAPDEVATTLVPVIETFKDDYSVVGMHEGKMLMVTNQDAPNRQLVSFDPNNPAPEHWSTVLPEREHVLESVSLINGKLVARYLENVQSQVYLFDPSGENEKQIDLPGIGIVEGISGRKEDDHFYYSFVDYTHPTYIYRYDFPSNTSTEYFKPEIAFDSDALETKQVWYTSKDGTKIPMFITHKKGFTPTGDSPCFLFGYGGFNVSYTPEFRLDRSVFLENDGVYAVANLRGGGEFGEEWHQAGTLGNKQNVFDDFIGAAEFLIEEGYTNPDKLAVHGRSNGGLLIGAVMTQRPNLMKVAIPKVGVLDMLKFHQFTIGKYWVTDYGCSDNAEDFEYLRAYSPVHNVKANTRYPATLVVTGAFDDRVVPAHSYKFIAELQEKQVGNLPVLIRIDTDGGHGAGKPVELQVAEFADTWSFVFEHLGMTIK